MKYIVPFLLSGLILFNSCKKQSEDHLPLGKMEKILMDIQLAEVYSSTLSQDTTRMYGEKKLDSLAVYYKEIFKHHDVTKEQFETSMQWYRDHPEDFDSVYIHMLPEFSKLEGTFPMR